MKWPQDKCDKALGELRELYRDIEDQSGLNFKTPYELLVATVLSAQCTDVRVNKVTAGLFKKADTPQEMIELGCDGLLEEIRSCGLAPSKTKNIIGASELLIRDYNSEVPKTIEELTKLPGVGRKTANVVLSQAYGIPGIAVDTHVNRVSKRLGLADGSTVLKVEQELMERIPRENWAKAHHWLIWHGRNVCKARKPDCEHCPAAPWCRYACELQDSGTESGSTQKSTKQKSKTK
ncbi:MAG: endonuclease III [Eubacteriaceae bacterium]|jgi:endonuclease-3